MNGIAALKDANMFLAKWEYEYGPLRSNTPCEHDDCGETALYPLSPFQNELFYYFIPEISR